MARNEHKRQQKLAKKKQRTNSLKKERNIRLNLSNRELILSAAEKAPWIGCYLSGGQGMHTVYAIRQSRNGPVASIFLIDTYCLGVKDAFFIRDFDMETFRARSAEMDSEKVTPEHACKMVQEAITYARGIGLEPSPEAGVCKMIFGNLDLSTCSAEFTFGYGGKPRYIAGPNDSPERQKMILSTLAKLGAGNFDFIVDMGGESSDEFDFQSQRSLSSQDDDFEDDEFEDDESDDNPLPSVSVEIESANSEK